MLDFTGNPDVLKVLTEAERLSFGQISNPAFATEISNIDPLPHQRIAVYEHMLKEPRLRMLLADDAGAGKTIMTGLYIRESLARRTLRRILIVVPAGLVGNWRRELLTLFNLRFRIISGSEARLENPFQGGGSDQIIISLDTLTSHRVFSRLQESMVVPYDLIVFDEAHKLSADRGGDLRVRSTERYLLAEALAGVVRRDKRWELNWSAQHLLLLTATPHMGKDYPYYALWRLLEPELLSTSDAFEEYPPEQRSSRFLRRTKEEMVRLDGSPLYPKRISDTLGYQLSQGDVSEQTLYDETTDYLRYVYNRAKLLNREAARLAMSVFQRRLASSTYALLRSFERRGEKLDQLIANVQEGKLTQEQLLTFQKHITDDDDILDRKSADDESSDDGREEHELGEERLLEGVVASSLADLLAEREQVKRLQELARLVIEGGHESKFEKLCEVLTAPEYKGEKLIVFTEHRDTLIFLARRLSGMGFTDQIAQIHGGMHYTQREEEVERFRKPINEGGARFLVCTDAAGEGINLQFCWIMVNYDVPWNPARLEQRMGRIHRYGQKHDPVVIINLVAPSTREGKVLGTLLEKLEKIRKELKSDKVFDCIGRVFQDVSIKRYMELAVSQDIEEVTRELDGRLTSEQIEAIIDRERRLYGAGGEVQRELPRLRAELEKEIYFRLLPGYVRQFIQDAAALLDFEIDGEVDGIFTFRSRQLSALDPLIPAFEFYPEEARKRLTLRRLQDSKDCIWLRPGEQVFERLRSLVNERFGMEGLRGAIFVDPITEDPYLFHLALLSIVRKADPEIPELDREEVLECRLVGVKQSAGADIELHPVEHLLLLKGGLGLPASAQRMAVKANELNIAAEAFLSERVARKTALGHKERMLGRLPEREMFLRRGFDYQEAELAAARAKHSEKARSGNRKAIEALEEVKRQQRQLTGRREQALKVLYREPELISSGEIQFIAHALVVPSTDPADLKEHDANVELAAMRLVEAFEVEAGAQVLYVHTPELARSAGLPENPGFDMLSTRPGNEKRAIEVKGRAGTGDVEVSSNEWAKACNLRDGYWLYAVYECATPTPRLIRVQDPFGKLLAKAKNSVLISHQAINKAAEGSNEGF